MPRFTADCRTWTNVNEWRSIHSGFEIRDRSLKQGLQWLYERIEWSECFASKPQHAYHIFKVKHTERNNSNAFQIPVVQVSACHDRHAHSLTLHFLYSTATSTTCSMSVYDEHTHTRARHACMFGPYLGPVYSDRMAASKRKLIMASPILWNKMTGPYCDGPDVLWLAHPLMTDFIQLWIGRYPPPRVHR